MFHDDEDEEENGEYSYTTFEPPPRIGRKYRNKNKPHEKREKKEKKKGKKDETTDDDDDESEAEESDNSDLADEDVATMSQHSISSSNRPQWTPANKPAGGVSSTSQQSSSATAAAEPPAEVDKMDLPLRMRGGKRTAWERDVLSQNDIDPAAVLPPAPPTSLQEKHLLNVNTIMRLSLLKGDWRRAKRAFKLLLGSCTDVRPTKNDKGAVDLRGLWEIGVEILALECEAEADEIYKRRQDQQAAEAENSERGDGRRDDTVNNDEQEEDTDETLGYGGPTKKEGEPVDYTKVTDFLERLIVMYPYNAKVVARHGSKVVSSKNFLPTLFHYRILTLSATLDTIDAAELTNNLTTRAEADAESYDRYFDRSVDHDVRTVQSVIDGIDSMLQRLSELQFTPPWVDMLELWQLRGMLNMWGADIVKDYLMNYPSPDDNYGSKSKAEVYSKEAKKVGQSVKDMGGKGWEEMMFRDDEGGTGDANGPDQEDQVEDMERDDEAESGGENSEAFGEGFRSNEMANVTDGPEIITLQRCRYMGSESD